MKLFLIASFRLIKALFRVLYFFIKEKIFKITG